MPVTCASCGVKPLTPLTSVPKWARVMCRKVVWPGVVPKNQARGANGEAAAVLIVEQAVRRVVQAVPGRQPQQEAVIHGGSRRGDIVVADGVDDGRKRQHGEGQ